MILRIWLTLIHVNAVVLFETAACNYHYGRQSIPHKVQAFLQGNPFLTMMFFGFDG